MFHVYVRFDTGKREIHLILPFYGRAFVKKKGRNNVTVDELVHVITPKGRGIDSLTIFFFCL